MKIKALSPLDLITALIGVSKSLWSGQTVMLDIQTNVQHFGLRVEAAGDQLASHSEVQKFLATVQPWPFVRAQNAQLKLHPNNNRGFNYNGSDELFADITLENPSSRDDAVRWLSALDEHVKPVAYVAYVGRLAATDAEKGALQIREQAVADMQAATAKLGDLLATITINDVERRKQLQFDLERDYRAKADAYAAEHQQKLADVDERRQRHDDAFAERERAFEEREKAFETGEAKFVRRDMLKKLQEILKESEQLELSQKTQGKRVIVHRSVFALLAGALVLATTMGWKFLAGSTADWHYALPMATGTITFFATLIYYVKWNDRWFREHAEGELAARRYRADIVRANWLAELVSERAQAQDVLPPELLEAYTRNLFLGSSTIAEAEHPFEQITGLIRRAKKLEVGGGKFLVDLGERKDKAGNETR